MLDLVDGGATAEDVLGVFSGVTSTQGGQSFGLGWLGCIVMGDPASFVWSLGCAGAAPIPASILKVGGLPKAALQVMQAIGPLDEPSKAQLKEVIKALQIVVKV